MLCIYSWLYCQNTNVIWFWYVLNKLRIITTIIQYRINSFEVQGRKRTISINNIAQRWTQITPKIIIKRLDKRVVLFKTSLYFVEDGRFHKRCLLYC